MVSGEEKEAIDAPDSPESDGYLYASQADGSSLGITEEKTVWCSQCSEWAQDASLGFRARVKRWGWTLKAGSWSCPECSERSEHNPE